MLLALTAGFAMPPASPAAGQPATTEAASGPLPAALKALSAQAPGPDLGADLEVAAFYQARNWRPLWIDGRALRPEARTVLELVTDAAADGLRPEDYDGSGLAASLSAASADPTPQRLARAELSTSRALAAYIADLHRARPVVQMVYADPEVRPWSPSPRQALEAVAAHPSLASGVAAVRRMNPVYEQLRAALRRAAPDVQPLLRVNLERARALPVELGRRYVLVDSAAQTLGYYEDGQLRGTMPVVVGKVSEPTPMMAGLIRYAVFRPYWNVPPDLARDSVAPKVLRNGLGYLTAQHMEALSDWTAEARVLDPATVDWAAVAAGRVELRLRQRPGRDNMMGQVKFMFPNTLGVYLHDTPIRAAFASSTRNLSAGCVRLQDAPRLAHWLLGSAAAGLGAAGPPEQRVEAPDATPVYLIYLTAAPQGAQVARRADVYGRDAPLLADLGLRAAGAGEVASR